MKDKQAQPFYGKKKKFK